MVERSRLAIVVGLVVVVAACSGSGSGSPTPTATTVPTSSPASPSASAAPPSSTATADFTVGGDRPVLVRVPIDFDRTEPTPLLIVLHGFGSSATELQSYFPLGSQATDRGFLVAAPDGTRDREGRQFWNATDACCDFGDTGVDDAGYLRSLIEEIGSTVALDPRRIYVGGHSNGGFMSYRMACEHADLVAAIVSVAGAAVADPSACAPSEPVAVLHIHGDADDTVRYEGGDLEDVGAPRGGVYPGVEATVGSWAAYDGCAADLTTVADLVDVDARIDGPAGPAESTVMRATDCDPGGHVELWTIAGGGHVPEAAPTLPDVVLDFLLDHPKP